MADIHVITKEQTEKNINLIIDYLNKIDVSETTPKDGITVDAAIMLYDRTGADSLKQAIVKKAEELLESDVCGVTEDKEYTVAAKLAYAAYKINGSEEIKNRIIELEKSEKDMGIAFDMSYETAFGGKEHYHQLTVKAAKRAESIGNDSCTKAMFMMALIDTIEAIEQPVYELYRSLVDLFREQLNKIIKETAICPALFGEAEGRNTIFDETCAEQVLACAIKKACDMKVILAEKYEKLSDVIFKKYDEESVFYIFAYALRLK